MAVARPLAVWPRLVPNLQQWAQSLLRQLDLHLVRGGAEGILTIDGVRWQQTLVATADPLAFIAPFDVAVEPPPQSVPLATLALLDTVTGGLTIMPWSPLNPPPSGYWTLQPLPQVVRFATAPAAGTVPVFLTAILG